MKKLYSFLLMLLVVTSFVGCDERWSPSHKDDDSSSGSYSGYAPDENRLKGKWIVGPSVYVDFLWNGSQWNVRAGAVLKALNPKTLQFTGGQVSYKLVDAYTATLEWTISYTYTYSSYNKNYEKVDKQASDTDTGNMTLYFTSPQDGYCKGTSGGVYDSYREFHLE